MNNETGSQNLNSENLSATPETVAMLQSEIERMKVQLQNYTAAVGLKVDAIEKGMEDLVVENERLIAVRQSAEFERDACVALIAELAIAAGLNAGVVRGTTAVVDLPVGQVSWQVAESEAHLLGRLPAYEGTVEQTEMQENYTRVMNSGLRDSGRA